ncbi:MAG TPA: triose-phosphate isomerase [Methylophilaceae bacterium]|nr:triose-phosphate isomerase [Methylophilaceae bacterium]
MRRKLVVANRKMHGSVPANQAFLRTLLIETRSFRDADIVVCVPHPYLFQVQAMLTGSHIAWGDQHVSRFTLGAHTGSVSASMLLEFGCQYTIIGHSERRAWGYETDLTSAQRFETAIRAGLRPIYCVGDTREEYLAGETDKVTFRQLSAIIDHVGVAGLAKGVLAYEPVWAIGTGQAASPAHVQMILGLMRKHIASLDPTLAAEIRILYGGSVKAGNAAALFSMPDVDGALVGSASLVTDEFIAICRAANEAGKSLRTDIAY